VAHIADDLVDGCWAQLIVSATELAISDPSSSTIQPRYTYSKSLQERFLDSNIMRESAGSWSPARAIGSSDTPRSWSWRSFIALDIVTLCPSLCTTGVMLVPCPFCPSPLHFACTSGTLCSICDPVATRLWFSACSPEEASLPRSFCTFDAVIWSLCATGAAVWFLLSLTRNRNRVE